MSLQAKHQVPPVTKRYDLGADFEAIAKADWAMLAINGDAIAGVAAMNYERGNRRARLEHLYVDRDRRGQGVGRRLVEAALAAATAASYRCLWAETQTVNGAAIEFYQHLGWDWCGFDAALYDPAKVAVEEVAVFFVRHLVAND
ncbi:MAG TPA: GNAT family N-acetyltransferase [Verrucomicrobiae bacterium]|nr:GNAT family N-acetyltransferase [Verrucomicrobiae bacterium]